MSPVLSSIPLAFLGNLHWLDWVMLVVYALGMLGIGWYYAVRTKSVDEYMLGSRAMNPWLVGLSMFVTYMSILTYLALPGEMVGKGPVCLGSLLAFPVAFLIAAIWIIPFAMRRQVVSAYELLETRFGTGMRMCASSIFLVQRFIWMGVIVFAVADKIFVPIFDLPLEWVPYVCLIVGLVTTVYSAMGGIKAVVMTDVVQAFILFAGVVVSIGYLVWLSGGDATMFWPKEWHPHWPQGNVWFGGIHARISVFDSFLAMLVWYVATLGADQMAIQRYLTMGSVSDARKMLGVSFCSNGLVMLLLGVVGLGLLAFYSANPGLIPGQNYISGADADKLYPLFILHQLPSGFSGLLIAAILAAAMSSLSAGINSSSSVVLVDFIEQFFGHHATSPKQRVFYARTVSVVIGLIVVGLSILVAHIHGNLYEICYRVVNLLVGPLFVTFFLAIFIPWASKWGVWIATLVSLYIAVYVAYFWVFAWIIAKFSTRCFGSAEVSLADLEYLKIGFNWITISSLTIGVVIGMLISLILPDKKES